MDTPSEKYSRELAARDLQPQTRTRYLTILDKYRDWLGSNSPCPELGRAFIAELRDKGYAHRSIGLYASVLTGFHVFLGEQLGYKHRKRKTLPPYCAWEDVELLLGRRDCPLTGIAEKVRLRDFAILTTMAYAGLRRSEVTKLRVGDVNFTVKHLMVRDGKGGKDRRIPLHDARVAALRPFCENRSRTNRVFEGSSIGGETSFFRSASARSGAPLQWRPWCRCLIRAHPGSQRAGG